MTHPYRVAMLSYHTSPIAMLGGKETGGMNVYVRELSRHLASRGLSIDIYTRAQAAYLPEVEPVDERFPNARVIHIPAGPRAPANKHGLISYMDEFIANARAFARREGLAYDLFHSHYWLSGVAARALQPEWPEAPIIQMFHTLGVMKNRVAIGAQDRETDRRIEAERELLHTVDRVVAATPRDMEQMIALYDAPADRIAVIPPGVDTELFHSVPRLRAKEWIGSYNQKTVLFVGRIDPVKGLDNWFRAMRRVVEIAPDLRNRMCICLIGGDVDDDIDPNSEMARLDRLKDDLEIADLVTFLGGRAQSALPYYYSAADLVVMPSRYESFGLAALEAMACGTPVVASDVGGLSFVVRDGETGYLVPEGDIDGLARCILDILLNPPLRARMSERAVEVAQDYAWPVITNRILDLYHNTIQNRIPKS
ncbi:MAG: glycosyltransferase [Anaerolineae bacterium]